MKVAHLIARCALSACAMAFLPFVSGCGSMAASGSPSAEERSNSEISEGRAPTEKTLYSLARILIDQGRYTQAELVLTQVTHDQPTMVTAFGLLGTVEMHLGKPTEALQAFQKGLEVAPTEPVLLNNAGLCYVVSKDYESALPYFQRAVQSDGRTPRYRANLAMALAMNGKYNEALEYYQEIMSASDAHHNLSILCTIRGDADRAKQEAAAEHQADTAPAEAPASNRPVAMIPGSGSQTSAANSSVNLDDLSNKKDDDRN